MKFTRAIQLINELVSICENVPIPLEKFGEPYRSFDIGASNISYVGLKNVKQFQDHLEQLYNLNKNVSDTWTLKKFESQLICLIRLLKKESRKCDTNDIEEFYASFLKQEIHESEVLYELYGVEMSEDQIDFGDFTVYKFDLLHSQLTKRYPSSNREVYFSYRKSDCFVGIKVKARENAKAVEIADKLIESFENVWSYMIADLQHERAVGVYNFRGGKTSSIVLRKDTSIGFQGKSRISIPVHISNHCFLDSNYGNDKLWKLITKPQKTELEKRILSSVEWIGKAIHDLDMSKSLVQFVFAIEGMLQYNEKSFITPSIVSQLSEWLAFIISEDLETRKLVAKYFKDIYQKRSAIAHGAAKTVDIQDLYLALEIAKRMVISFLTKKPFNEMSSLDELNKYLTDLKFK